MDGLLLVDKPREWTSFDVVNKVRRIVAEAEGKKPKNVKVGHTGTLDPLATGLLVLVLGSYCKRAQELSKQDKTYEVLMCLGKTSTTGDEEGEKTAVSDTVPPPKAIEGALQRFRGDIMQIPPAYSAIKVNGQRAYKLARAGQDVQLEARPVRINTLELTDYSYPEVRFTTNVSSGTYIRSLVEDIGLSLHTGAYMADLRRTTVGGWDIVDALSMDGISMQGIQSSITLL